MNISRALSHPAVDFLFYTVMWLYGIAWLFDMGLTLGVAGFLFLLSVSTIIHLVLRRRRLDTDVRL